MSRKWNTRCRFLLLVAWAALAAHDAFEMSEGDFFLLYLVLDVIAVIGFLSVASTLVDDHFGHRNS